MSLSSSQSKNSEHKGSHDIDSGRRVLANYASALLALANTLDDSFSAALDIFDNVKGRVVVTGMGKAGHVGAKITATLASTGTPAMFVHPAEASHGDLGMITKDDALFILSNSGETSELVDILSYAVRYGIPTVALTGRLDSTLARAATVTLTYPVHDEACPMGLAPTTSTTMMVGLGDAVAVSLLERKGFSPDDFHKFHPGGQLGKQLLKISDLMHKGDALPLVTADTPLGEMIVIMTEKSFGCAGIVDSDGRLSGIFTDGDLRRAFLKPDLTTPAGELMTADPKHVSADSMASEAILIMNESNITTLFVTEDSRPIGILHLHDCLRAGIA
ncbi:MAG: KpsF/GutQ family sugar-phosphate isomerase [Rhodospirillales bacterium]|jgi:arabinose-5-phosphate isomerase|nr:KpsF/GutQ family sugar-phosphate isomerase [Rhodospirillales bacterium]MBT4040695.1 KpsF/GutQ family sugar-phosphate isomerase [Rhodospirillales bacterium]MBT4626316.1 KpsF/GutQ family sugar-phosphate isomerase [Rhodospirillales bacterium]MBT5353017.1 KpsF/GutQ family sugar-phosphate isomerase [Rhodospirillales bacterium]MBT5520494.1 KpsF/GutQ family sugar-phosphate isomerase [Rhodospirillales bacterium]